MLNAEKFNLFVKASCTQHTFSEVQEALQLNAALRERYYAHVKTTYAILEPVWSSMSDIMSPMPEPYQTLFNVVSELTKYENGVHPLELGRLEKGGERFPLQLWSAQRTQLLLLIQASEEALANYVSNNK